MQGQLGQALWIVVAEIETKQQIKEIDVIDCGHASGQIATNTPDRQHLKASLAQFGDKLRVDQRTLARARLGIEEHQSLGNNACQQCLGLTFAAKVALAILVGKGTWSHVWILIYGRHLWVDSSSNGYRTWRRDMRSGGK